MSKQNLLHFVGVIGKGLHSLSAVWFLLN